MSRVSWDQYFQNIAWAVGFRATCDRAMVGAVIVSEDNRILATGYNGAPSGRPSCDEVGCEVVDGHCQRSIHAEVNAIAYAARAGVSCRGARLYMSSDTRPEPCRECWKVIAAAGITYIRFRRGPTGGVWEPAEELWPPTGELPENRDTVDSVVEGPLPQHGHHT